MNEADRNVRPRLGEVFTGGYQPALHQPALILRDDMLQMLHADGGYDPIAWAAGGPYVTSLLPGWTGGWIYRGFAPLQLIELNGPDGRRATWFADQFNVHLGDTAHTLSETHQDCLTGGLSRLRSDREAGALDALALYGRICPATRMQIESLLPNASYDRALELCQVIAARTGPAHHVAAAIDVRTPAQLPPELTDGWRIGTVGGDSACIAVGGRSVIRIQNVPASRAYRLSMAHGPVLKSRRMRVSVNGRLIAITPFSWLYHNQHGHFSYWIPPELVTSDAVEITLEHETIDPQADEAFVLRRLKLDVGDPIEHRGAASNDIDLMLRFQSIGDNCQFGFVQRHFGAEPMSLFRFAGAHDLIAPISAGLAGLGDPGSLSWFLIGTEYQVRESKYSIFYHTFKHQGEISPEILIAENEVKLRYLARKFIEDLEDGETIWVTRRVVSNDISEVLALHAAIGQYGPNKLFWITRAPQDRNAGDIEWLMPNLLRGYLAPDASHDPHKFDADHYKILCQKADRAFRTR